MDTRACARLLAATGVALGAVVLACQPGGSSTATPSSVPGAERLPATSVAAAPARERADVRRTLQHDVGLGSGAAASGGEVAGSGVQVVDESKPHQHRVDPVTGGLVSIRPGTVPRSEDLGPVHVDPLPAGVSLDDPTDTRSLYERAGVVRAALAAAGEPVSAGATAPVGTPSIPVLSSHVTPSCTGTGTDGKRVQVVYAHESGVTGRYTSVKPLLLDEVAGVDDVFAVSSAQTDGGRRVRWVSAGGCIPSVLNVTLPSGSLRSDFNATISAMRAAGYQDPNRKYLVFAEASSLCGIGTVYDDDRTSSTNYNNGYAASYARVDLPCWSTGHSVPAHELTHNLGGVQDSAPHSTKAGHCYDESDLMCYVDSDGAVMRTVCPGSQEQLLDCGHDDYFSTAPTADNYLATHWNTAASGFLDVVPALGATSGPTVTVTRSGASTDSVRTGEPVEFTATASRPSAFAWTASPACPVVADGATARLTCPSTVTGTVTVTARATATADGLVGRGTAGVLVTKAAAPTVSVVAPASAAAGAAFPVTANATGTGDLRYTWSAAGCSVADPAAPATTVTCAADTASQNLPVTVAVSQADGQVARATSYVSLVGAAGPVPTRTDTRWSTVRTGGGHVAATLSTTAGAAVPGTVVQVQVRWWGSTLWRQRETVTTSATGVATTSSSTSRAGWVRFVKVSDADHAGATSASLFLRASTRVRASSAPHHVAGSAATIAGVRLPGVPMTLQHKVRGTSRWVDVVRLRTDSRGLVARTVRPWHPTYYRWVFRGGSTQLAARSTAVRVHR